MVSTVTCYDLFKRRARSGQSDSGANAIQAHAHTPKKSMIGVGTCWATFVSLDQLLLQAFYFIIIQMLMGRACTVAMFAIPTRCRCQRVSRLHATQEVAAYGLLARGFDVSSILYMVRCASRRVVDRRRSHDVRSLPFGLADYHNRYNGRVFVLRDVGVAGNKDNYTKVPGRLRGHEG